MEKLLSWIFKSRATKLGTSVVGGGTILSAVFFLHQDIKFEVAQAESRSKQYSKQQTQNVTNSLTDKLDNLEKGQDELKDLVKTIDARLYNLKLNN